MGVSNPKTKNLTKTINNNNNDDDDETCVCRPHYIAEEHQNTQRRKTGTGGGAPPLITRARKPTRTQSCGETAVQCTRRERTFKGPHPTQTFNKNNQRLLACDKQNGQHNAPSPALAESHTNKKKRNKTRQRSSARGGARQKQRLATHCPWSRSAPRRLPSGLP